MAVWQWDLWLVPKKQLLQHFPATPRYVDLDWFESIDWWNSVSESELATFFNSVLPYNEEKSTQISRRWGNDEQTCIRMMIEEKKITDVFIRIDARQVEDAFVKNLLDFAKRNDFLFFPLESNRFIDPERRSFISELKRSRAMLFAKAPDQFFNEKSYLDKINKSVRRRLGD